MTDHRAALDQMLTDMADADALYRPTQFWRAALEPLVEAISREGVERFRSMDGPLSFFVPTYGFPRYRTTAGDFDRLRQTLRDLALEDDRCSLHLERLLSGEAQAEADYRVLLASDRQGPPDLSSFSESTVGNPLEHFSFDGRRFSRSSLNYLLGLAFLKRHCDTASLHTVLEIGAGFGSLGEILLSNSDSPCLYVDVDIPPTIHVATHYLKQILGEQAVLDYQASRGMATIDLDQIRRCHKAVMLAAWQLPRVIGQVDLFVNFISFQEMEPDVVRNYLSHVQRLGARYVLLRNLREGKAKARHATDVGVRDPVVAEMYDAYLDHYSAVATNTVPFGYLTVDGFHSELRLYKRIHT